MLVTADISFIVGSGLFFGFLAQRHGAARKCHNYIGARNGSEVSLFSVNQRHHLVAPTSAEAALTLTHSQPLTANGWRIEFEDWPPRSGGIVHFFSIKVSTTKTKPKQGQN